MAKAASAKPKKKRAVRKAAVVKGSGAGLSGIAAALGSVLGRTEKKVSSLLQDLKRTQEAAQAKRATAGSTVKQAAVALGRTLGRAEKELTKAQAEFKRALSEARK
jgi:hypothetical protein